MPRRPALNAEIRDNRREEILRAALRVFAERGLKNATVSDIARAAGMSHGLLYHYFASKDALVEALFEQKFAGMRAINDEAFDGHGPILPRMERACERMLAQTEEDPDLALFVTQALVSRAVPDALRLRMAENGKDALDRLAALIEVGQRSGEIAGDASPEALATAVAALVRGLALFHEIKIAHERPAPPRDVLTRLLRPQIAAPEKAPPPRTAKKSPARGEARDKSRARKESS
jgi:AcrR family transcriptional regulator